MRKISLGDRVAPHLSGIYFGTRIGGYPEFGIRVEPGQRDSRPRWVATADSPSGDQAELEEWVCAVIWELFAEGVLAEDLLPIEIDASES